MQERYEVVRLWVRISHGTLTVLLFLQETTIIECLNFINYNVLFMDHAIFVIFHLFCPKWQVTKRTFSQHINFFIRWHFSILMEFFHYYWKTLMVKTENIETVKINFSSFWRRFWKNAKHSDFGCQRQNIFCGRGALCHKQTSLSNSAANHTVTYCNYSLQYNADVAEWLRRRTVNPLDFGSVSSNPILVASFYPIFSSVFLIFQIF